MRKEGLLRLCIWKYGLSGDMIMTEGKRIYMESEFLNSGQELSFRLILPGFSVIVIEELRQSHHKRTEYAHFS